MIVPRFYRLKKLLFSFFARPRPDQDSSSKRLQLRRRIFTLAFDDCRGYFSQYGQDKFVDQVLFAGERGGVFLDVGAYDGTTISNSYFLEQSRGWSGMCIEPQAREFAKLQDARKAICVNGCAALEDGFVDFLQVRGGSEMLSGRIETYDAAHLEGVRSSREQGHTTEVVRVRSFALPGLLRAHAISRVDFLSVDTEGGELDLLKSLDLASLGVRVICVENNRGRPDIEVYLLQVGYELVAFMGCDEIYRRSSDPRA